MKKHVQKSVAPSHSHVLAGSLNWTPTGKESESCRRSLREGNYKIRSSDSILLYVCR